MTDGLSAWLTERLPDAMRPRQNAGSKKSRCWGTSKMFFARSKSLTENAWCVAPSNPNVEVMARREADAARDVQKAVLAVWSNLLGVEAVNEDKAWDAAGGDLLKALELIFTLRSRSAARSLCGSSDLSRVPVTS